MKAKNRNIVLIVLFIMIGLCTALSVSYAYYTLSAENYELSTHVDIPSCTSISVTDDKAMNLSGDYAIPMDDDMLFNSDATVLDNYKYTFTVTNNCSDAADVTVSLAPLADSTMPTEALKYALVPTGTSPSEGLYVNDGTNGRTLTTQIINDIKIQHNYDISTGYILNTVSLSSNQSVTYDLYLWVDYYEGDATGAGLNNDTTMNKTFNGIVVISDYNYIYSQSLTLGKGNPVATAIVTKGTNNLMSDDGTWGIINENGYRYEGDDPANYICFGSEEATCPEDNLYRIIGAFETEYDADGDNVAESTEYLAKIQKYTMYGDATMKYHSTYLDTNANSHYPNSEIYPILNTTWYGSLDGSYQNKIANANWKLGSVQLDFYSLPVENFYTQERGTTVNTGVTETEKVFKLGLIYPSDYGYGVLASNCARTTALFSYNETGNCYELNWLYDASNNQWTIASNIHSSRSDVIYISKAGAISDYTANNYGAVRPTFYLKANVKIAGGKGTIDNPYRIA